MAHLHIEMDRYCALILISTLEIIVVKATIEHVERRIRDTKPRSSQPVEQHSGKQKDRRPNATHR